MLTPTGVTASAYTDAIMAGNPVHVRLTNIADNVVFTDEDIELNSGLQVTSYMNGEVDLTMGMAVMDELQVALFKSSKTQDLSWNSEFKLEMGVEISGTTNWVTVGYYIGKRPERFVQDDVISLQAVDRMSLFEKPAQDYLSTLTVDEQHPITISALYQGICTYCNVTYTTGDEISAIMARSYTMLPFSDNGMTCRDVIAWIAEANCCYARLNSAGNMVLTWYHDHMDEYMVYRNNEFDVKVNEIDLITNNALKKTWSDLEFFTWEELESYLWGELEGQEAPFRIHALNVRMMAEDSGVMIPQAADRGIYMIVDNPFLKTENTLEENTYLYPIYNRLVAFGQYIPMHLECIGNWLIEPGDVISVEVGKGNQSRLPIFTRQLKWNGACTDQYEATGNLIRETVNPYVNKKLIEGGRMHVMKQTIDESYEMIQDELGNYSTKDQTAEQIQLYVATKADIIYSNTAPTWLNRPAKTYDSVSGTYEVGDYCLHTSNSVTKSYRCTTPITTPEAWDSTKWSEDVLPVAVGTIWVNTSPYLQTEADAYNPNNTYNVGDLSTYNGSVYQCNTDITTPETWDSTHWDLFESPVPKNEWSKYNGSSWELVSENNVYEKKSGIDINSNGVSIYGDKYVKIQAGAEEYWNYDKDGINFYDPNVEILPNAEIIRFGAKEINYGSGVETPRTAIYCNLQRKYYPGLAFLVTDLKRDIYYVAQLSIRHDTTLSGYFPYFEAFTDTALNFSGIYRGIPVNGTDLVILSPSRYNTSSQVYIGNDGTHSLGIWGNSSIYLTGYVVAPSSRDIKHNIKDIDLSNINIDALRPVSFVYDEETHGKTHYGFIYEELINEMPNVCETTPENKGINYTEIIPVLVKEIQSLRSRIAALENKED